jgi:hypothetical protein
MSDVQMEKIKIKLPAGWNLLDEAAVFKKFTENRDETMRYIHSISEEGYLHWEKARYVEPPKGLTSTEAWYLAREVRKLSSIKTPVRAENGDNFTIFRPDYTDRLLREIDMHAGGDFIFERVSTTEASKIERQKYITRGIIEEAIASSQKIC